MKVLEQHEQFEMLILDEMRKVKILDALAFGGGTMLRLCFDLPRYSVDFDFYLLKEREKFIPLAENFSKALRRMGADITDEHEKHFSFLWELRMTPYPRRLKIEVRKDPERAKKTELNIAHSPFFSIQVRLRTLTLGQMWGNKVQALVDRKEIRDAYDLEFLTRRGAGDFNKLSSSIRERIRWVLNDFSDQDFKVVLGSILSDPEKKVVLSSRLGYLKSKLVESP
ncbi:MAG: nucleotidyl transferase AbiEii/AbiGii toxin family protein [Deltaproteobacteria bacterium]|nr:nucleotidyl transferase AbiEii/AbiGii toxin family protein [Deltaproteobacteria bacterium]